MRHSPERVADVACGVFGIERCQLYGRDEFGVRRKSDEFIRRRSLVVKCVRRITGASFPRIAKILYVPSHSSIINANASTMTGDDDQAAFDLLVIGRLQASEPRHDPSEPVDRDTRCDGVWFSPACREER